MSAEKHTRTPRIYWVFIIVGAAIAGFSACSSERSAMSAEVKSPPADVLEMVEGAPAGGTATEQCAAIYEARAASEADSDLRMAKPEECAPYRNYRDLRAPKAFVFALFGSLIGMFIGMFVNRQARERGALQGWVG